jgi:hypothetical protein
MSKNVSLILPINKLKTDCLNINIEEPDSWILSYLILYLSLNTE